MPDINKNIDASTEVRFVLNSVEAKCQKGDSVRDILKSNKIKHSMVAVEIDKVVIPRSEYEGFLIEGGMSIEIVEFVGGG